MAQEASGFVPIERSFFAGPPDAVARALLGCVLLRRWEGELLAGRIVETEAYFGEGDPAAHAFAGRTARNAVLWGEPGHAYVYFIYGMHACLNVSCEPVGQAGCVLIRALEPLLGLGTMARLRGLDAGVAPRLLTSGPGRLCQALAITRERTNGADLLDPAGDVWIAAGDTLPCEVAVTPRIGIRKAVERPLRFCLRGHDCVSGPGHRAKRQSKLRRC